MLKNVAISLTITALFIGPAYCQSKDTESPTPTDASTQLRDTPDVDAGVVLHLAREPSIETWALGSEGRCLFYVISDRENVVEQLRTSADKHGRLGLITFEHRDDWRVLPLAARLANLVVIEDWEIAKRNGLTLAEALRVTAPFGKLYLGGVDEVQIQREIADGELRQGVTALTWSRGVCLTRLLPADMGEWTHAGGGPGKGSVAADRLNCRAFNPLIAGALSNLYQRGIEARDRSRSSLWPRWIAGEHRSGAGNRYDSLVIAGGRVFGVSNIESIAWYPTSDSPEAPAGQKVLVARDAFNGLVHWHLRGPRRVFAASDRHVLVSAPLGLGVLDAATGRQLWSRTTGNLGDVLMVGDVAVWYARGQVHAAAAASGEPLWSTRLEGDVTLMAEGIVVLAAMGRHRRGEADAIVALNRDDGTKMWSLEADVQGRQLVSINQGRILVATKERARVLELTTGKSLLERERAQVKRPKSAGGVGRRTAQLVGDHLILDVEQGYRFVHLQTGKEQIVPETTLAGLGAWPCNGGGALTMGTILASLPGAEAAPHEHDLIGHLPVKNSCGEVPPVAYHTVFQAPHKCACSAFFGRLRGFVAAGPITPIPPRSSFEKPGSLVEGPAFGAPRAARPPAEWPAFRADSLRSCATSSTVSAAPEVAWRQPLASDWPDTLIAATEWRARHHYYGRISAPVADQSNVYVALPDDHQVVALDAATGKTRWRFIAGGAVDSPPSLYGGAAYFGSRDGWLYAVDSQTGDLMWKRRISPVDTRVQIYGQLENRFPVRGAVTVRGGRVYATAGLHGMMGVMLCVADAKTGDVIEYRQLPRGAYHNDVLVKDAGGSLFLGPLPLDLDAAAALLAAEQKKRRVHEPFHRVNSRALGTAKTVGHLLPLDSELLNTAKTTSPIGEPQVAPIEQRRPTFLCYLHGQRALNWTWNERVQIGIRSRTLMGWKRPEDARAEGKTLLSDLTGPVVSLSRETVDAHLQHELTVKRKSKDGPPQIEPLWQNQLGTVWLVALAGDRLILGGPMLESPHTDPLKAKGKLWVVDAEKGTRLAEVDLPRTPIQDGIAIAAGRVFCCLSDGSIVCLK